MLKNIKLIMIALASIFLISCEQDIGVNTEYTQEVIVQGVPVLESGRVYDQAVDVLLIIDESCSMRDDYETLANTMPDIYDILTGDEFIDLDWRVGIRSTDPSGTIYDWVDHDDQDVEFKLNTLIFLLKNYGMEQGLDSAIQSMAWDETGFFRDDADLLIIYISDEPDQSSVSIASYKNLASIFKQEPFEVTEAAIVATYEGNRCDSGDLGVGYIDVAEVIIDMCDTYQWATALDTPREHLPTLNEVWPLSKEPIDPDEIKVSYSYNGVIWAEWDDWYYDEDKNTVYMTVVPRSGGFVNILYLAY